MASTTKYKNFIGPRFADGRVLNYQARVDKEAANARARAYAPRRKQINKEIKLEVLAHYGPDKELRCSFKSCVVSDPDMLTIDHINNDGAADRRSLGGKEIYRRLKARGYPDGHQTMCWNQWKKEMMRRGEL